MKITLLLLLLAILAISLSGCRDDLIVIVTPTAPGVPILVTVTPILASVTPADPVILATVTPILATAPGGNKENNYK